MKQLILTLTVLLLSGSAFAQDVPPPPNDYSPIEAYSIFVENYKNEGYESALPYGRWLITYSPTELEGYPADYKGDRTMERMITVYEEIAKKKQDPSVRSAYLDSALQVYDKGMSTFSEDEIDLYDWEFNKGRFYQQNASYIDNGLKKAYQQYEKIFEMDPERTTKMAQGYYVQITLQNMVSKGEKEKALKMIEQAEPFANEKTLDYFDKTREKLFDSPEERIAFYKDKLKEDPENVELLTNLFSIYEEEEMNDKAADIAKQLYEIDPNYENTIRLANNAIANANYDRAIKFLKEAQGKTEDKFELRQIALDLSQAYLSKEDLKAARKYARDASQLDPDWGKPYIRIADIYSRLVQKCTETREMTRQDRVLYWLILDYLDKAKKVDSSVANTVNQQYSTYKQVTLSKSDIFFLQWEEGDEVKVNGSLDSCYSWVKETTTVR